MNTRKSRDITQRTLYGRIGQMSGAPIPLNLTEADTIDTDGSGEDKKVEDASNSKVSNYEAVTCQRDAGEVKVTADLGPHIDGSITVTKEEEKDENYLENYVRKRIMSTSVDVEPSTSVDTEGEIEQAGDEKVVKHDKVRSRERKQMEETKETVMDIQEMGVSRPRTRVNVAILMSLFTASLLFMLTIFWNFPKLDEEDISRLRFPSSLDAAKDLGRLLSKYKDTHYFTVLGGIVSVYIFSLVSPTYGHSLSFPNSLQTFAVPGSIFFSILSGFLFPFPLALLLVCTCSSFGATFCYFLSAMVGQGLMKKHFPHRLKSWQSQVAHHHDNMLWYIIFLRITPFLPNWFINLASPILGVKVGPFFWGTFIGVAPPSFFFIRAGTTLYELTTASGHVSIQSILILTLMAVLSLMPVLFKSTLKKKMS